MSSRFDLALGRKVRPSPEKEIAFYREAYEAAVKDKRGPEISRVRRVFLADLAALHQSGQISRRAYLAVQQLAIEPRRSPRQIQSMDEDVDEYMMDPPSCSTSRRASSSCSPTSNADGRC